MLIMGGGVNRHGQQDCQAANHSLCHTWGYFLQLDLFLWFHGKSEFLLLITLVLDSSWKNVFWLFFFLQWCGAGLKRRTHLKM